MGVRVIPPSLTLETLRPTIVDVLRGDDPAANVQLSVESVEPPALLLLWSEPWLEPATACNGFARPAICCVAGRIEAPDGVAMLDRLVNYTLSRIRGVWTWERTTTPDRMTMGNVDYLSCRVILRIPIMLSPEPISWPVLESVNR